MLPVLQLNWIELIFHGERSHVSRIGQAEQLFVIALRRAVAFNIVNDIRHVRVQLNIIYNSLRRQSALGILELILVTTINGNGLNRNRRLRDAFNQFDFRSASKVRTLESYRSVPPQLQSPTRSMDGARSFARHRCCVSLKVESKLLRYFSIVTNRRVPNSHDSHSINKNVRISLKTISVIQRKQNKKWRSLALQLSVAVALCVLVHMYLPHMTTHSDVPLSIYMIHMA